MDSLSDEVDAAVPEHFLALFHGGCALALGATVWSAMAAVFGAWALAAAPALGWMIAWACCYGGRRVDGFVRGAGWFLALAGVLAALFAYSAFSATQLSPDSGPGFHALGLEYLRLFAEPPWLGSVAVLLALAGARRAQRPRSSRPANVQPAREPGSAGAVRRPDRPREVPEPGSRAA